MADVVGFVGREVGQEFVINILFFGGLGRGWLEVRSPPRSWGCEGGGGVHFSRKVVKSNVLYTANCSAPRAVRR